MNNTRKKAVKGFTLVELVIVMAIFGVLLMAVISIARPVSNIFRNAETSEKTYAYSNNIQLYLQNQLQYADNISVKTTNSIDVTHGSDNTAFDEGDLTALAEDFRDKYYKNIVTNVGSGSDVSFASSRYMKGNIYILQLSNSDGQIYLRTYPFVANEAIATNASPVAQLNPAYFDAGDANYALRYALGSSTFIAVDGPADSSGAYKALDTDVNDTALSILFSNLNVSIVAAKQKTAADAPQTVSNYTAFKSPASLSVASIPLLNLSFRKSNTSSNVKMIGRWYANKVEDDLTTPDVDESSLTIERQSPVDNAFEAYDIYSSVDFGEDIYFVYAYADELTASDKNVS